MKQPVGDSIAIRASGPVSVVIVDDGKANVLTLDLLERLAVVLSDAASRSDAVVLAGRPGYFSAGLDRSIMIGPDARESRSALLRAATALYELMIAFPVPLVAACTGHALAGGAVMLLCSDVRIGVAGDAKIGLPEVALGMPLPPLAVAASRLRLHPTFLFRATFGGETFESATAVEVGFLDEVRPLEQVVERAVEQASLLGRAESLGPRRRTRERLWAPVVHEVQVAMTERRKSAGRAAG